MYKVPLFFFGFFFLCCCCEEGRPGDESDVASATCAVSLAIGALFRIFPIEFIALV